MATITDPNIDDVDTSNVTSYVCASFTPVVNDLLVFGVATSGSVEPTAAGAMTDDQSGTYTLVNFALRSSSASSVYIFVRNQAVSSAVGHVSTFTCTGDAATGCCIVPIRVAGMSRYGASSIKQSKVSSNNAAGGTPAITFTSAVDTNNPTIAVVGAATNPPAITEATGWTEISDAGVGTPAQGIEVIGRNLGFSGSTITWGSTSAGAFGIVAVELDTSTPPAGPTGPISVVIVGL